MDAFNSTDFDFLPYDEEQIYLVGGTVRDLLCGQKPADIDIVVQGEVGAVAGTIANKINGKIIDLGKNEFALLRIVSKNRIVDVSPMTGPSIEADLQRRDFTINAMAYDLKNINLVDGLGGWKDLQEKKIRMISGKAFKHDPVRLIRAYRMAATFGFTITDRTKKAISKHKDLITCASGERIWAELVKLFSTPVASPVVRDMADSGLLTAIIPELEPSIGCKQNRYHQFDVFDHSLRVFEQVELLFSEKERSLPNIAQILLSTHLTDHSYLLKYAALLHDVGKSASRTSDSNGRIRFPGHAAKGAKIAIAINAKLKLSNRQRKITEAVIRHHIRPLYLFIAKEKGTLGRRGIVRFFRHCGALTPAVLTHAIADIKAKKEAIQDRDSRFIAFCDHLAELYLKTIHNKKKAAPLVNGRDLILEFGLAPSPLFKFLLNRVDEQHLTGILTTRNQALNWVAAYLKKQN
jgi:poly(A) polymerase